MKKFHIIVIVLFGFLLMPSNSFACEMNSSKHSSTKETSSSKMEKDDCCKNDNHSKTNNQDGCGGKCKHSKCSCATSCNSSTVLINESKFNNNLFNFASEKQKFYNYETSISSGFNSLWLIPKIS
jgi:hypothetical protein